MGEPPSLTQMMGRRSLHPAPLHPDPADPPSRRSNVGGESGRMRGGRGKNFAIQTRNRSSGKLRQQRGPPPQGGCKSPGSETCDQRGGSLSYPNRKAEWTGRGPTPAKFRTQSRNATPRGGKGDRVPDKLAIRPPLFYKEQKNAQVPRAIS